MGVGEDAEQARELGAQVLLRHGAVAHPEAGVQALPQLEVVEVRARGGGVGQEDAQRREGGCAGFLVWWCARQSVR